MIYETIVRPDNSTDRIDYVWGKDISGTLDGAAGIGGLLYVKLNGVIFVPFYDAYGNVMGYRDAEGNTVAEYVYDAFGRLVSPQEQIDGIRAVTAANVKAVAKAILRPANRSVSWVVPK